LDPPPLDDGPHLSYAIQWFAFTLIALVFAGIMLRNVSGNL
jgi:cytochrome oxidase assembly protein ShyY1